jgi:hypothetical protein
MMRGAFFICFGLLVVAGLAGAQPAPPTGIGPVDLESSLISTGLTLPESEKPVFGVRLRAVTEVAGAEEGAAILELDPSAPVYDEFGHRTGAGRLPWVKRACTLKFVKKRSIKVRERIGGPEEEVEWHLYEVRGAKITSRLALAFPVADRGRSGRLLVLNKDGKVQTVIAMHQPPRPIPCHPGCFPAGTSIRVPDGTRAVERVRAGDLVTTIGTDGKLSQSKVQSVFVTRNRLWKVATDAGDLVTTETQPLALAAGGLRAAGELKAGDRILRWDGHERKPTTVRAVTKTEREEAVYNLVLGDPALFVANGYLARSKPPAEDAEK